MVYTRFGGFSRRSIFQHSMHGDLRSDQTGMLITVSEEQMHPTEFCKMISDGHRGCGQGLHRKSRNAFTSKVVQFRCQHRQTVNKFDASMLLYTRFGARSQRPIPAPDPSARSQRPILASDPSAGSQRPLPASDPSAGSQRRS